MSSWNVRQKENWSHMFQSDIVGSLTNIATVLYGSPNLNHALHLPFHMSFSFFPYNNL